MREGRREGAAEARLLKLGHGLLRVTAARAVHLLQLAQLLADSHSLLHECRLRRGKLYANLQKRNKCTNWYEYRYLSTTVPAVCVVLGTGPNIQNAR